MWRLRKCCTYSLLGFLWVVVGFPGAVPLLKRDSPIHFSFSLGIRLEKNLRILIKCGGSRGWCLWMSLSKGHDTVYYVSQSLPARPKTTKGAQSVGWSMLMCVSPDKPIVNYFMRWGIPRELLHISKNILRHFPLGFQSLESSIWPEGARVPSLQGWVVQSLLFLARKLTQALH